jgi:hypothetical protein
MGFVIAAGDKVGLFATDPFFGYAPPKPGSQLLGCHPPHPPLARAEHTKEQTMNDKPRSAEETDSGTTRNVHVFELGDSGRAIRENGYELARRADGAIYDDMRADAEFVEFA